MHTNYDLDGITFTIHFIHIIIMGGNTIETTNAFPKRKIRITLCLGSTFYGYLDSR